MTLQLRKKIAWRSRLSWLKRNRAFVAAPLLGTIIFLACVIFIINLNKVESANVVLTESESYHNRIVSLLEMYRSDTSSLFRQQLTYVIEHYLTSGCWLNLFDVDNGKPAVHAQSNPGYNDGNIVRVISSAPDTDYTIQDLRYSKCKSVNHILSQVSQSVYSCKSKCTPKPAGECDCDDSTPLPNPNCASMKDCSDKDQQCMDCENALYGLPKILHDLSADTTFEGITFRASNPGEFNFTFTDPGGTEAEQFSSTLLGGSLFDCGAYARDGSFQCCSISGDFFDENLPPIGALGSPGSRRAGTNYDERYLYDWTHKCEEREGVINGDDKNPVHGQIVTGCEDGSFFMRISLNNKFVYQRMPRFMADDTVGNQLRTGALGESDFFLPISYPLYKYINYSFELFERLAYADRSDANEGESEGIADGLCVQSVAGTGGSGGGTSIEEGRCRDLTKYNDEGFTDPKCEPGNQAECENAVWSAFVEKRLHDSCTEFYANPDHPREASVYLCVKDDNDQSSQSVPPVPVCSEDYTSWHYTCGDSPENGLYSSQIFRDAGERLTQVKESQSGTTLSNGDCPASSTGTSPYCSAFQKIILAVRFNDLTEEHQVDPEKQNTFCSYIRITHYAPNTSP